MFYFHIGIGAAFAKVFKLSVVESYAELYGAFHRLYFNLLSGLISVTVYFTGKESDINQKSIVRSILFIFGRRVVKGIHVCLIVVTGGRCGNRGDHKLCVIRDGIRMH